MRNSRGPRLLRRPLAAARSRSRQASYDALTGLPNRSLFRERLARTVADARNNQSGSFAVLLLDLDGFRTVNQAFGHAAGDAILKTVGRHLAACLHPGDTIARLGDDEFAVLLTGVTAEADALRAADRILKVVEQPCLIDKRGITISASAGIAISGAPCDKPAELLRRADIALHQAKTIGKGRAAIFHSRMHAPARKRFELAADLRGAVDRGELQIVYQPEVDLASGAVAGVEALLRWQHPLHGLISPDEFIPLAEETGLIVPIGAWVLREACREVSAWKTLRHDRALPMLSVNLSARQIQQPDLVDEVARILSQTGFPASSLRLEITESVLMRDTAPILVTLHALRRLGVRLAIDDFGTGYSSLSYLHRFPVDTLKIDRSFVSGDSQQGSAAIVRAVTALAHALGLDVTAEGIETEEQRLCMEAVRCDQGQGYLFCRPVPADALLPILERGFPERAKARATMAQLHPVALPVSA